MYISGGDGGSGTIIVDTDLIHETGGAIEGNAGELDSEMKRYMSDLESEYSSSILPTSLRNTLHSYTSAREIELDKMVKRRHTIGDLLTKAADLHAFNENMQKRGFASLYQNINGFYGSSTDNTDLANMQRGDKFTPSLPH